MYRIKKQFRQWQSHHATLALTISIGLFVTSAGLLVLALSMQTRAPSAQQLATPSSPSGTTAAFMPTLVATLSQTEMTTSVPPSPSPSPTSITQETWFAKLETPSPTSTNPPTAAPFTATPTSLPTSTVLTVTPTNAPTSTLPTATPTSPPTSTPPTATAAVLTTTVVMVTADALHVRQGPGVQYASMGLLQKGMAVTVTARNLPGDWLQVQGPKGESGWVSAMYVEAPPGYDLLTVATVVPPPFGEGVLITHGDRNKPMVALTFDACQSKELVTGYDAAIIRTLTETHTAATLFLGGLWAESHRDETRLLAQIPYFELGNHSYSHPNFANISPEVMIEEITKTQEIIHEFTSKRPTLFRLPFGTYTQEALDVISGQGLRIIQWDVVTGDPDPNISAEDIIRAVETQARNGSIVIMHMNERGWHTAEALPTVIAKLQEKGFQLVTVSELLAASEGEEP